MCSFFLTSNDMTESLRLLYQKHRVKKVNSIFIYVNIRFFFRIVVKPFFDFRLIKGLLYFSIFNRSEFSVQKRWNADVFEKMPEYEKNCSLIS